MRGKPSSSFSVAVFKSIFECLLGEAPAVWTGRIPLWPNTSTSRFRFFVYSVDSYLPFSIEVEAFLESNPWSRGAKIIQGSSVRLLTLGLFSWSHQQMASEMLPIK